MEDSKLTVYLRICAFCCAGLLGLGLLCAVLLVPPTLRAITDVSEIAAFFEQVDWTALTEAATDSLRDISRTLQDFDIDTFNKAVHNLQAAISPLARLFGG